MFSQHTANLNFERSLLRRKGSTYKFDDIYILVRIWFKNAKFTALSACVIISQTSGPDGGQKGPEWSHRAPANQRRKTTKKVHA